MFEKSAKLIEPMSDPMIRINQLKAAEKKKKTSGKKEASKRVQEEERVQAERREAEIAFRWMEQFEQMYQERKLLVDSNTKLQANVAAKQSELDCLKIELNKERNVAKDNLRLLQMQMKNNRNQQKLLERFSKVNRRLRILNHRKKQTIHELKLSNGKMETSKSGTVTGKFDT